MILKKIEELTETQKNLINHIEKLKKESTENTSNLINLEEHFAMLQKFHGNCSKSSLEDQKSILKDFIKQIVMLKEGLVLEYYGRSSSQEVIENTEVLEKNLKSQKVGTLTDISVYRSRIGGGAGS